MMCLSFLSENVFYLYKLSKLHNHKHVFIVIYIMQMKRKYSESIYTK